MRLFSPSMARALCYADVFEYPLTRYEIEKFQIPNSKSQIPNSKLVNQKDSYFFLKGRENIVAIRKERTNYSRKKLAIANRIARYLQLIPTIQMVAVTGALAMENAKEDDDIDFLIVTKPGTIWTTRCFSVLMTELLGIRRRPNDITFSDKVCLNMFIDEDHLQIPKQEQDLFSAHEVAQVKILWMTGDTQERFWSANRWINKYLPKFQIPNPKSQINLKFQTLNKKSKERWIEQRLKDLQFRYMSTRRTNEVIRDGYLRFHPFDTRKWVLTAYQKRLKKFGLE